MRSSWSIRVGSTSKDRCPISDKQRKDTQRRGDFHVRIDAEVGVMWSQAKESPEPLEVRRGKERFFPRAFGGSAALLTP